MVSVKVVVGLLTRLWFGSQYQMKRSKRLLSVLKGKSFNRRGSICDCMLKEVTILVPSNGVWSKEDIDEWMERRGEQ